VRIETIVMLDLIIHDFNCPSLIKRLIKTL